MKNINKIFLHDLSKIDANEIVVRNIIKRTENEFIRLTIDVKKNERNNKISILVGIAGILVSIIMTVINLIFKNTNHQYSVVGIFMS